MQRLIYKYDDGNSKKYADPVAVITKAFEVEGLDLEALVTTLEHGDERKAMSAFATIAKAARAGFDLQEFDPNTGEGLTDLECAKLFADFWSWIQKKSLNTHLNAMFTQSTDCPTTD